MGARERDKETETVRPPLPGMLKGHEYVAHGSSGELYLPPQWLKLYYRFDSQVMLAHGGGLSAGRQLISWALKGGARRDQISVSYGTWLASEEATKETCSEFPGIYYLLFE
jgi:hypothetical protein